MRLTYKYLNSIFSVLPGKDGVAGETPEKPGFHFFGGSFEDFAFTSTIGGTAIPPFITVNYDIRGKNAKYPTKGASN